jgi:hypothetical protein
VSPAEWFEGFAGGELAAVFGTVLLVLIAWVPVTPERRGWLPILGFVVGLGAGAWAVERWIQGEGLVPKGSDVSRHLEAGLDRIRENVKDPWQNLVLVGGGSYVSYGVNPGLLEQQLTRRGYQARVVHLAEPGANHLERRRLYWDLVHHPSSVLHETPKKTRVVLLEEVQRQYDREPMTQMGKNLDTARLTYYLTPGAAFDAFRAVYFGGGEVDEDVEHLEWNVVRTAMIRGFNAGAVDRLTHFDHIKARHGYTPARAGRFRFPGVRAARKATRERVGRLHLSWLDDIREPGIEDAFDGEIDRWVYFAVPTTHASYVKHSRAFCRTTKKTCIALDDPKLYQRLSKARYWHNAGHLSYQGAAVYTKWLAARLAESGVLKK